VRARVRVGVRVGAAPRAAVPRGRRCLVRLRPWVRVRARFRAMVRAGIRLGPG
jgi:hypothetical protein